MYDIHYYTRNTLIWAALLALTAGVAIGLGIAVFIAMRTLQMDFIYMSSPASWGWL